jgi:hypothetical protein
MATGRPTKRTPKLYKLAEAYLASCVDEERILEGKSHYTVINDVKIPSIEGLALALGVHRDTLYEWEKEDARISDILTRLRAEQAERLLNNGLAGKYNPIIAKLMLSKHGYIEKTQSDTTIHTPQPLLGGETTATPTSGDAV